MSPGTSGGADFKAEVLLALKEQMDKRREQKDQTRQERREDRQRKEDRKDAKQREKDYIHDLSKGSDDSTYPIYLVLMAILAHLLTILWEPPSWTLIIAIYLMIIVLGFFIHDRKIDGEEMGLFLAALLAVGLPYLFSRFRAGIDYNLVIVIGGLIMFTPIMTIYLLTKSPPGTAQRKILTGYMVFWCIIGIFYLLSTPFALSMDIKSKSVLGNPGQIFGYTAKWVGDTVSNFGSNIGKSWDRMIKYATGQPYNGEEDERRGVYLEKLKAIETEFYTSTDARLQAQVTGVNLVGTIYVKTSCYVPGKAVGSTFPDEVMLVRDEWTTVDCNLGKLPKGSHQAKMTATFTYQTDATIEYYFVDIGTRPELYADLKIPKTTIATYTGGPAAVGLSAPSQPMKINISRPSDYYRFGVSLQNNWPQGKITRGLNYILDVPAGVKLTNCNRELSKPAEVVGGRTQYTFSIDTADARETFDSVSCGVIIDNIREFFSGNIMTIKTFSAKVTYEYMIEQSTYILVKDDYTNT